MEEHKISDQIENQINNFLLQGKYVEAEKMIKTIKKNLQSVEAVVLIKENRYDEAEDLLNYELNSNGEEFDTLYNLAYLYFITGRYEEASDKYMKARNNNDNQEVDLEISEILNMIQVEHKNEPLVSVCMPVYNDESNIVKAVESVLNQTYQNFEIVICDNNSEDKTFILLNNIEDKRIRLFRNEENIGMLLNSNKTWKLAKGKIIVTLHGDDSFKENYLEKVVKIFNDNKKVGVTHFIQPEVKETYFENVSYFKAEKYYSKIASSIMIPSPTQTAFRVEALMQTNYYEKEYWTAEARLMMKIADLGFDAYIEGKYLFDRYTGPEKDSSQIEKLILRFEHLYNFYEEYKDDKKIKSKDVNILKKSLIESFFFMYQNKDKNSEINEAFLKNRKLVENNLGVLNIIIDYMLS